MGRKGTRSWPAVVQRLVELGTSALVEQLDLPKAQALIVMREVAHQFAVEYGGAEVYVAKDEEYALTKRDEQIFDRMDRGESTAVLADAYGLTPRQVQIIAAHVRRVGGRARLRQSPLFDDADA